MGHNPTERCPHKKRRFEHKKNQRCTHTEESPCADTARRWSSASQGERSLKKPPLLTTWSWTSRLQNCEKIDFYGMSHAVCGVLLWQPEQTNTNVILQMTTFAMHPHQNREKRRQLAAIDSRSPGQLNPPSRFPVKFPAGEAKAAGRGWSEAWGGARPGRQSETACWVLVISKQVPGDGSIS